MFKLSGSSIANSTSGFALGGAAAVCEAASYIDQFIIGSSPTSHLYQ